ncbi:hypothetical protein ACFSKU_10595 [Pontibacter silvestris]|uniref:POTRA domain-containing protein n=1 Tax=Pontibacter silvestris TaxID=2305183 RepID=A0ABW4WY86_9BACT|nr:hypothetical protein [Pontibacter silvestris]MCC9136716.1 hypothetical protein [Pontibacter silvestris]
MFLLHLTFIRSQLVCLLGILLLSAHVCCAQEASQINNDSTQADSTRMKFDERVMENLRQISERKTIMGKFLKAVLDFDRHNEEVAGLDAELIKREYEKHNYKIVRHIEIRTLDPLGYSINDTARVPRNFLEKAGNSLHVKTGRSLIRNKLLFRKNEPLEPLALVESERLLRQTEYLLDARIIVNEQTTTDDSVDVYVLAKDIFSLGGSGSYSPSSGSGRIAPRELNFLGQGHQLRTSYRFGMNRPRPWEFDASYSVENIGRSYISADVIYSNQNYYKEKSAYLSRDFFSTNTKYAGAVGLSLVEERLQMPSSPTDTAVVFGKLTYNRQEAWLGRAIKLKNYNLGYEAKGRLIVGLRVINTDYKTTPTENFQDNTLMLGSIGYSVRKYYKDRFLFGFGRTEDIPAGTFASLTYGYEKGAIKDRRYFGATTSLAKYSANFGYLYGSATYGSYIRDNKWEQGMLDVQSMYFTRLLEWGNWKLRHYVIGRATIGINRNPEELLSIDKELGLRGFRSEFVRGSRRAVLNYEANLYTPFTLFGFRLAALAFADVAWLSTGNKSSPFNESPYRGFGVGLRFRNEYLSFSTIQILIGYYPKLPQNGNMDSFRIFGSSRPYYDFTDFRFTTPGVVEFR